MIDFHNHILPNVDDGSKSMKMTMNMLRAAHNQGIKRIINTVHLQHPKMEGKNTDYKYIESVKNDVLKNMRKENLNIEIYIASEVYYLPNLCELIDNPLATFNNYMLIEFPSVIIPSNFLDTFFGLRMKGVTPILAHPERYRFIQEDFKNLEKMRDLDIIFQIDAGSLLGHFGKKVMSTAFKMLREGYCHVIGSDAHNDARRNFCLKEVYDILSSINRDVPSQLVYNSSCFFESNLKMKHVKLRELGFFQRIMKKISNT